MGQLFVFRSFPKSIFYDETKDETPEYRMNLRVYWELGDECKRECKERKKMGGPMILLPWQQPKPYSATSTVSLLFSRWRLLSQRKEFDLRLEEEEW